MSATADIRGNLEEIIGAAHVSTDDNSRSIASKDIFYDAAPPLCVVRPDSVKDVRTIVSLARAKGIALAARGGGLSYSAGYLTGREATVLIDMRRFNRIVEINEQDMYVHVEAGVTWADLNDALKPLALRTPFWGTGSGLYATVGGGLSQNAINYGSGRHGTLGESVIALEVVLGTGEVLKTGSWATPDHPTPFNRYYGPDLTGLFVGDTGPFGIKTSAVLQLIPRPMTTRFAAYSFAERSDFTAAAAAVGRLGLVSECFGLDPFFLSERIASTGFADDIDKLIGVAKGQSSMLRGAKEAFLVAAAGRRYLKNVGYSLHMSIDGRDDADVESAESAVRDACEKCRGDSIPASIPKVMRGTPFPSPVMMLGPHGDRWVPMHGIVPHSRHLSMLNEIDAYMDRNKDLIDRHQLVWGQVSNLIGNSRVLVEVNLYWKDRRTDMIESYLDDSFLASKGEFKEDADARAAVHQLRQGLSELFRIAGGTHLQIGRSYPYLASRLESTALMVRQLKQMFDPDSVMNPGSLGL